MPSPARELRGALEGQMAEKKRKMTRKYFVEPKIGASQEFEQSSPPEKTSPQRYPQRSNVSPSRRADGNSVAEVWAGNKSAELRAALEEQIEEKRRRRQEAIERERIASRELLQRAGISPERKREVSPERLRYAQITPMPSVSQSAASIEAATRNVLPPTWHSHEFLDLTRKEEEEKKRKQAERLRAEELRLDLERQMKEKEALQKKLIADERREYREYELRQQRIRDDMVQNEKRRQEEQARSFQQLQEENKNMRRGKDDGRNSPVSNAAPPSPVPFPVRSDSPVREREQQYATAVVPAPSSAILSPSPQSENDMRQMLSRIHREILQQRQDLMSPSIFTTYPLSNIGRMVSPIALSPIASSPNPDELPNDRQFVHQNNNPLRYTSNTLRAAGAPFSMTGQWNFGDGTGAFGATAADTTFNPVADVLRRNQARLRQLKFARNHDDLLRIFLAQDTPGSIAAATAHLDLPPPSFTQTGGLR